MGLGVGLEPRFLAVKEVEAFDIAVKQQWLVGPVAPLCFQSFHLDPLSTQRTF